MDTESNEKSFIRFNNFGIFPNKAGICAIIVNNQYLPYYVNKFSNKDLYIKVQN
jgi:hypothetical protein